MTSHEGNPRGEIVKDGPAQIESVGDYLAQSGVSCGLIGSYRTREGRVHQHDAMCLVQAGRESMRRPLEEAEEQVRRQRLLITGMQEGIQIRQQEGDRLRTHLERSVLRSRAMETFMRTTPGVGPYVSVWDMWLEHEEERAEEAQAEKERQ